jgi:outer membrane protein assembly factor BamB
LTLHRNIALAGVALLLAGCSGWFGDDSSKKALPGKRIPVLALDRSLEADPRLADVDVRLPRPYRNADWPETGGTPNHAMHHLSAKGGLAMLWSEDIGDGGDGMLLAQPIIAAGHVFTMDVRAEVRSHDAETGNLVWRARLAPKDADGILGGGLAWNNGKVYVTTGFADVIALDGATGRELWRRRVSGPLRAAPTVYSGRVFVVTIANELFALDAVDGRVLWNHIGITETAGLLGGASPAADGNIVVVPYSSGELFALRIENGRVIWSDSLSALRRFDPVSSLSHIRGQPVIDRGQVIATSNSGRTVAIDLRTGSRIWERPIGSNNAPWVAGDFIYMVSSAGDLLCLSRRTGGVRWVRPLQHFEDEEDREGPLVWSGPVLAGDRLLVGSSDGQLWSVSPYTGKLLGIIEASGGVFIPAAVANDTVYVLTNKARLLALR